MQTYNIGRNPANEIVLDDKMVSRQHAQLFVLDNGQVILKDLWEQDCRIEPESR
jgi:pSer/pThr/pTyr-binding forkhead associated (FHA) protein